MFYIILSKTSFNMRYGFLICTFLWAVHLSAQSTPKKIVTKPLTTKPATAVKSTTKSAPQLVQISTHFGNIVVQLYDSTPLHKENFIKLVKEGFYDSLLFHRIIDGFMIQGGDPTSKTADSGLVLGNGGDQAAMIKAEFNPKFIHKKGALAAARTPDEVNPQKMSSSCQFYLVQGRKYTQQELEGIQKRIVATRPGFAYTQEQIEIYTRIGGTPFLDMNYTVFGEVIQGLDVIDRIAKQPKDPGDRPKQNIRMKMKLIN
jgi:cyclophilin family peptidyl-prolyl cis-trans isomerase